MLQAGRSWDWIPDEVDFFNLPNPSSCTMALGATQTLTEMSTRNIPGGEGRPAHKADNLTAICEPIVYKMWEPQHLTTLWVSTARYRDTYTYLYLLVVKLTGLELPPSFGTGEGSLRVLRFSLPILIPTTAPHSWSSIIRGWYNRPIIGLRTKWTQSHPTPKK
jgi:hypothetical protein